MLLPILRLISAALRGSSGFPLEFSAENGDEGSHVFFAPTAAASAMFIWGRTTTLLFVHRILLPKACRRRQTTSRQCDNPTTRSTDLPTAFLRPLLHDNARLRLLEPKTKRSEERGYRNLWKTSTRSASAAHNDPYRANDTLVAFRPTVDTRLSGH